MSPPSRAAAFKLVAAAMVPAWGRAVVAIVGSTVVAGLVGQSELSGYAVIPGVFLALSGPAGTAWHRVRAIVLATVLIAALSFVGAELSRSAVAVVAGLGVVGFAAGVLPRAGPIAAALQLPMIIGFAYSAGQPLEQASAASRAGVILAALPVYVLATAVLFQVDQRRPLRLGAAAGIQGIAEALRACRGRRRRRPACRAGAAPVPGRERPLKDAAVPSGARPGRRPDGC